MMYGVGSGPGEPEGSGTMNRCTRVLMNGSMPRCSVIFLACFGVFLVFLTPNVNTGDAGELVTAAYHLVIAHPSGYPLYLMLGKAFTFLPLGNIAFRVALISAVFSALSLTLLYWLIFSFTGSNPAAAFATVLLMTSISYLHQSVIAKFYPLNLFLVLSICALWLLWLDFPHSGRFDKARHLVYVASILLGLISANHNTGMIALVPVLVGAALERKKLASSLSRDGNVWRVAMKCFVLFLSGFLINGYLLLRGGHDRLANVFHVTCAEEFIRFITRQTYREIGTLSVGSHLFADPAAFWYGLVNFISLLTTNVGVFSYPLFLAGCVYLGRRSLSLLAFAASALLCYGPVLSKLALPAKNPTPMEVYIAGHQYFLPALALYALFAGFGFFQVAAWLRISRHAIASKSLLTAVTAFLLAMLFVRYQDSNYRMDYVPYQVAKDTFSILPVNSIYLAFGDNERFQGRYLKLIGRYREDVCQMNAIVVEKAGRGVEGCNGGSYSSISPRGFKEEIDGTMPYLVTMRFFSDGVGYDAFPIEEVVRMKKFGFLYLYLPRVEVGSRGGNDSAAADDYLLHRLMLADGLINPDVCTGQHINDLFTSDLCKKYLSHFKELTRLYLSGTYPVGTERDRRDAK